MPPRWVSLRGVFPGMFVSPGECVLWLTTCDTLLVLRSAYTFYWAFLSGEGGGGQGERIPVPYGQSSFKMVPAWLASVAVTWSRTSLSCCRRAEAHLVNSVVFSISYSSAIATIVEDSPGPLKKLFLAPFLNISQPWTKMLLFLHASSCVQAPSYWPGVLHGETGRGGRAPLFPSPWGGNWKIHSHEFL